MTPEQNNGKGKFKNGHRVSPEKRLLSSHLRISISSKTPKEDKFSFPLTVF